MLMQQK